MRLTNAQVTRIKEELSRLNPLTHGYGDYHLTTEDVIADILKIVEQS